MKVKKIAHNSLLIEYGRQRILVNPGKMVESFSLPEIDIVLCQSKQEDDYLDSVVDGVREKNKNVVVVGSGDVDGEFDLLVSRGGEYAIEGVVVEVIEGERLGFVVDHVLCVLGSEWKDGVECKVMAFPLVSVNLSLGGVVDYLNKQKVDLVFPVAMGFLSEMGVQDFLGVVRRGLLDPSLVPLLDGGEVVISS